MGEWFGKKWEWLEKDYFQEKLEWKVMRIITQKYEWVVINHNGFVENANDWLRELFWENREWLIIEEWFCENM